MWASAEMVMLKALFVGTLKETKQRKKEIKKFCDILKGRALHWPDKIFKNS